MRGLAAHSNGFHAIRALGILMSLLGTIDRPGGFRHKTPFPRPIPPCAKTPNTPLAIKPELPARRRAARLAGRSRRPLRRRRRQARAHRQGVFLGVPAGGARPHAQRDHQRLARRPVHDRHAVHLHGQHGVELDHARGRGAAHVERQGREGRVPHSVPGGGRRVPVGDDRVRRSRPARHHVPRAPRRHVAPRPPDLGVRRAGRFRAHPRAAAHRRVQAVPGGADRAGRAAEAAGLRHQGRAAQVPRLSGLHRQLRDGARLRHRLPRRLAREGRREAAARRAQSAAVGDVRAERLRVPLQAAEELPVHAQLEPGLPRVVAAATASRATPSRS